MPPAIFVLGGDYLLVYTNGNGDNVTSADYLAESLQEAKTKLKLKDLNNQTNYDQLKTDGKLLEKFLNDFLLTSGQNAQINNKTFALGSALDDKVYDMINNILISRKAPFVGKTTSGTTFETKIDKAITMLFNTLKDENLISFDNDVLVTDNDKSFGSTKADMYKNIDLMNFGNQQLIKLDNGLLDNFQTYQKDIILNDLMNKSYFKVSQTVQNSLNTGKYTKSTLGSTVLKSAWTHKLKEQKIDNAHHFTNFKIETTLSTNLERVLQLLSSCSFSDKAYQHNHGAVSIGKTNPFRVYLAMTQNYVDFKNRYDHWFQFLQCLDYHGQPDKAGLFFYKLRYIYELTGYGQVSENQQFQEILQKMSGGDINTGAQFLVYYYPGVDNNKIKVVPTKLLLYNFLKKISTKYIVNEEDESIDKDLVDGTDMLAYNKDYILYSVMKVRIDDDNIFEWQ